MSLQGDGCGASTTEISEQNECRSGLAFIYPSIYKALWPWTSHTSSPMLPSGVASASSCWAPTNSALSSRKSPSWANPRRRRLVVRCTLRTRRSRHPTRDRLRSWYWPQASRSSRWQLWRTHSAGSRVAPQPRGQRCWVPCWQCCWCSAKASCGIRAVQPSLGQAISSKGHEFWCPLRCARGHVTKQPASAFLHWGWGRASCESKSGRALAAHELPTRPKSPIHGIPLAPMTWREEESWSNTWRWEV